MAGLEIIPTPQIVNVASVPQRSLFRYPGGKTWLVPYVRLWLRSLLSPARELIEPFVGGGVVGLTAAFEGLARKVTMVELDSDVAAVWKTVLGGDAEWLAKRIASFDPTFASVREALTNTARSERERAFCTILRNRVQRGGILAPGAGLMKYGENGKGLRSRWYPETLCRRIRDIAAIRGRIKFHHGDGVKYIERNLDRQGAAFFLDPPYVIAGRRLYRHSVINHEELFSLAKRIVGQFLMTYDDSQEIRRLVVKFRFDCETIPMRNTHNATVLELLIGRDLGWLRRTVSVPRSSDESSLRMPEVRQAGLL
jgi:DNA adenine methylase